MVHVETRVRVGEIANVIWRMLGTHIVCDNAGDDNDFVLQQHDFDNNKHDKAVIGVAINGDVIIVCSVHGIRITLTVTGPDAVEIEIGYRVGRRSTGSIAEVTRRKIVKRVLDGSSDRDVAREIVARLQHMLGHDVEVLLNPHKAFDSKLDSSSSDRSGFDSRSEADAAAEPQTSGDEFSVAGSRANLIDRALLAACKACEHHTFNGRTIVRATSGRADQHMRHVCHGLTFRTPAGDEDEFDVIANLDGLLTVEHPTFKYPTRTAKFDVDNPRTLLPVLRKLLEQVP